MWPNALHQGDGSNIETTTYKDAQQSTKDHPQLNQAWLTEAKQSRLMKWYIEQNIKG